MRPSFLGRKVPEEVSRIGGKSQIDKYYHGEYSLARYHAWQFVDFGPSLTRLALLGCCSMGCIVDV